MSGDVHIHSREYRAKLLLIQVGITEPTKEQIEDVEVALRDEYEEALSRAAAGIRYLQSTVDRA